MFRSLPRAAWDASLQGPRGWRPRRLAISPAPPCYRSRHDGPQATGVFSRVRHRGGRRRPIHHGDPERPAMNAPEGARRREAAAAGRTRQGCRRLWLEVTKPGFLLIDRRHFCVHATHQVGIPWAVDRDKEQVSVWSDPALVKHLARRVIVAARPPFFLLLSAFVPHDPGAEFLTAPSISRAPASCFG